MKFNFFGKSKNLKNASSKNNAEEDDGSVFTPQINENLQIGSALNMVGHGFETRGGSSLMLTEAIENSSDAIIEATKNGYTHKREISIIIDKSKKRVLVIDDGFGFQDIRHVAEKPFKSLKREDPESTGEFARGLQGFRAFCQNLTFYTKRPQVPNGELDQIKPKKNISNKTVKIRYKSNSIDVKAWHIDDKEFTKFTKSPHGSVAIYENWKKGEFDKIRNEDIIKRVEHHFGELIRGREIKIIVREEKGRIEGIGPKQGKKYECRPKDYSRFKAVPLEPVPFIVDGRKSGEVVFKLYLTEKGMRDRWMLPFLMWRKRPVGDGHIRDLDDFRDHSVWDSQFLTGYIEADFCQINTLRTALEAGTSKKFLYDQILKVEKKLEKIIKEHSKGIFDTKFHKDVNNLALDLQKFVKSEFDFDSRNSRNKGALSQDTQESTSIQEKRKDQEDTAGTAGLINITNANIESSQQGDAFMRQDETGGHAGSHAETKGGVSGESTLSLGEDKGRVSSQNGLKKPHPQITSDANANLQIKKKTKRSRPRGIGIDTQENEFRDEPSWFESVTSTVVINSGHERYKARHEISPRKKSKDLMHYIAELYLWEICKLKFREDNQEELGTKFLTMKFKYFEKNMPTTRHD